VLKEMLAGRQLKNYNGYPQDEMEPLTVTCKDGFRFQIHAGRHSMSTPAGYQKEGNYRTVEIYIEPKDEALLWPFAKHNTGRYGFVRVEVAEEIIRKHGGVL